VVLRVSTLYASSAAATAAYYTEYLTQAVGEVPGVWRGAQAAAFGLDGEVTTDALRTLLEGRDPTNGTSLGSVLRDRTLANGQVIRAVAGFDATFSAPKSLSVWWALTGDPWECQLGLAPVCSFDLAPGLGFAVGAGGVGGA
jgi:conjugative relaxase-like TrwC/TraI family protein